MTGRPAYAELGSKTRPFSLVARFLARFEQGDGCWVWTGATVSKGYGVLTAQGAKPGHVYAHRLAWELTNDPIPEGLFICHHCDNPPCVRPDHLFVGTARDNTLDSIRKGRHYARPRKYGPECQFAECGRSRGRGSAWCRGHRKQRERGQSMRPLKFRCTWRKATVSA